MRHDDKSFISIRLLWKFESANLRSLWLAAFVGFLVTVVLGAAFPIIGHLIGGLVAGLIAGGGIGRGALAIGIAAIILSFFGAIVAAIGGLIGGAIAK